MFTSLRILIPLVVVTTSSLLPGQTFKIRNHQTAGTVDLVLGADRGTITQPLLAATIGSTGQRVLFVLSEASDKDFAELFGATRADALAKAPEAAVERAIFAKGSWTFFEDAGLVTRFDGNGNVLPPKANPNYSPLKRFSWKGKEVTVNAPFILWGDGPGQQLLIDRGGADPLIRSNPPSPFFVGGGPTNGADPSGEAPLDRYKGGQAVALDLDKMTVTMKLHRATFDYPDKVPYYTVFDASKAPPAGFMGVPHAPKLANIGRFGDNDAVGRIAQFSNGVRNLAGGPNRFQQGITSYPGGQSKTYTPIWHITWIFMDLDRDGVFFAPNNVGEGAVPVKGSGIPRFDPSVPAEFDPFQMDDKGVADLDAAIAITGNPGGFIEDLNHLRDLVRAGLAIETEGPPGLRLDSPLQPPLIVNCPVPITLKRSGSSQVTAGSPSAVSSFGTSTPGCAGPVSIDVLSPPQVGSTTFGFISANSRPYALGAFVLSGGRRTTPLAIQGLEVWVDLNSPFLRSFQAACNPFGVAECPLPIPADPGLVGFAFFAQFFSPTACAPGSLSASNGLAITVQ